MRTFHRISLEKLKTGAIKDVMTWILKYQVASHEPLSDQQKAFLWCAQALNDELRIRAPRRNGFYHRILAMVLPEEKTK